MVARELRHVERVSADIDQGPAGFHRSINDGPGVEGLYLKLDLAASDARDIEEIVDQSDEMVDLPGDDIAGPEHAFLLEIEHLEQLGGGADGCQRVAQLVGEHRQELVLAPVVFLDVTVEPGILDGDGGAGGEVFDQGCVVGREGWAALAAADGQSTIGLPAHLERNREDGKRPQAGNRGSTVKAGGAGTMRQDRRRGGCGNLAELETTFGSSGFEDARHEGGKGLHCLAGLEGELLNRKVGCVDPGELGSSVVVAGIDREGEDGQIAQERDCLLYEPARDGLLIERLPEHVAGLGEERRAAVCGLGGGPRGFVPGPGQRVPRPAG